MPPQIDLIRSQRLPGSSASNGVGRQGSGIPRQQTTLRVDLQDPVPADDFQRQPLRSPASKRPSGQGPRTDFDQVSALTRILRQANDVQHRLQGFLVSKTTSSAKLEGPRPAIPPRIPGKQTPAPTQRILVPNAKFPAQSANQAPISLASGSLVCEFVDQIAFV